MVGRCGSRTFTLKSWTDIDEGLRQGLLPKCRYLPFLSLIHLKDWSRKQPKNHSKNQDG